MASSGKKNVPQGGFFEGVVNPSAFLLGGFVPIYAALVPFTTRVTKPNGYVESAIGLALRLLPGAHLIPQDRQVIGLAALYLFMAMPFTGPWSVAGQAAGKDGDFDNNTPRAHVSRLRGLPLRLYSAHHNILENFPLWALSAALVQAVDPSNQQAINLLGLAALAKIFVYWPAYVLDIAPLRTLSHLLHSSAVFNVALKLATGF